MSDSILDVDLLAFERGDAATRRAVVDGVVRSLRTGFVYTSHDLSDTLLDEAYAMLRTFFEKAPAEKAAFVAEGTNGQTGYTGLLVETAAILDVPDWKEMLNWSSEVPHGHPLRERFPTRYMTQVLPEAAVPGITKVLMAFRDTLLDLQRRFLRIIAIGVGCHESFFEHMLTHGAALSRAIHYPPMELAPSGEHVWAGEHGDINLLTALPRATKKGLQVKVDGAWVDAAPPEGHAIINTGIMLERLTNGVIPVGVHQVVADPAEPGDRYSVVQFCHPTPWTILAPLASCITPDNPQRFEAIPAADLLAEVLWQINLVEDGKRVE